ncbi:hypothetical protein FN846DRAFT_936278 [Sphaerosporella brunnea]|uniref:F-box domain-containing protein n=1 Tax=Sphaerosporella brunnea TaxID=1250544 RepID=A0A5J5F549_9PEZI|nr:hypothetical protein FN846DRAFT_936278 [Sphaerosporella brunnea]
MRNDTAPLQEQCVSDGQNFPSTMTSYYLRPPLDPESEPLPSYEAATTRDPLPLIANYLRREDVFVASLVSQSWRAALMPALWGAPHKYWGMGERSELTSFQLFLRSVSELQSPIYHTHTLDLESVRPTIYTTLPPSWLSMLLTKLPRLRELVMKDFPFFDHQALSATNSLFPHHLHKLVAINSHNCTPSGLSGFLSKLPQLRTLDLSGSCIFTIGALPNLTSVSLRDLQLTDTAISPLLKSLGTNLRSLDVRRNLLTDGTVSILLDYNFAPPSYLSPAVAMMEEGLTHLRIAENSISVLGAVALIKSTRLVTLDLDLPRGGDPGQLVPALSMYSHSTLRTLRITHKVVMARKGLRRKMLPALRTLILTNTPEWGAAAEVDGLLEFISTTREQEGDILEVLELEMGMGQEAEVGGSLEGDFTFFEGEREASSAEVGGKETLDEVKKIRDAKSGWRGRIRVLRDLAGREVKETGVEGERWGVVRERV